MLNISICDDDKNSVDKLAALLADYCGKKGMEYRLDCHTTGKSLLADVANCDILFLDVDMGEENGISIAHEIRKFNKDVIIIYVSGYVQYAPAGYNVKAFAYILKNDLDDLFETTMTDVVKQLNWRGTVYKVKTPQEEISLPVKDILYIESFDKVMEIHTTLPQSKYTLRHSLTDAVNQLADKGFLQIHKSYVVNMAHISKLKNYTVTLTDGTQLTAAQKRWREIMQKYLEWRSNV